MMIKRMLKLSAIMLIVLIVFSAGGTARAGSTTKYTMKVGDTKTLYAGSPSSGSPYAYAWTSNSTAVVIEGGTSGSSCRIRVNSYSSATVVVQCVIYTYITNDSYTYSGQDFTDYQITIEKPSYTVTLNANGGSASASSMTVDYGGVYGSLPTPSRTGYIFNGWYSPGGTRVTSGSSIYTNADHTLTASWTADQYTILFNGNGSTGGSMGSMTCETNTSYALTANSFTRTGRTFECWNTKADGTGTSYADKATVRKLTNPGGSVTLYAIWKSVDRKIPQCDIILADGSYTYTGEAVRPAVSVRDGRTQLVQGTDYTVSYKNNINAGTATVTVTGKGNYSGSSTAEFTIGKADQTVQASIADDFVVMGSTSTIQATGEGTFSYSSDREDIARVSSTGVITGVYEGTAVITVTASGNSNYKAGSVSFSVAVASDCGPEACGPDISWTLTDGVLKLTGSGSMFDWPRQGKSFGTCDAPWYSRRSEITSVEISGRITSIGENAFLDCSNLTTITVPKSVTRIGDTAFGGCGGLTAMTVPFIGHDRSATGREGVLGYWFGTSSYSGGEKTQQYYASTESEMFYIPSGLTSIVITDTPRLSRGALYGCYLLTSVTLPDRMTSIGPWAFYHCYQLTEIIIPEGITQIEHGTFYVCGNLASITLPGSLTSIGDSAFDSCTGLWDIDIPYGVTSIGDRAFNNDICLTGITLPNSLISIGYKAFDNCYRLRSIVIPDSVQTMGESVFEACSGLTSITLPFVGASRTATGFGSLFGYIFGTYDGVGKAVTQYYASGTGTGKTYYISSNLWYVTITDTDHLPYGAFYNCSMISSLRLPINIQSFGKYCFMGCSMTVRYPSFLDPATAQNCGGNITWDSYSIPSLSDAVIAPIPDQFYSPAGATPSLRVTLTGGTLTEGEDYTVAYTNHKKTGVATVTITGTGHFEGNQTATFNILPRSLENAVISGVPEKMNVDGPFSLEPTVTLDGIRLKPDTDYVTSESSCDLSGNTVISIEGKDNYTGKVQKELIQVFPKKLALPKALTTIGSEAFANSDCRYVVIPDKCRTIGSKAFVNCFQLYRIWIPASVTKIDASAFNGCKSNLAIVAPKGSTAHKFAVSHGFIYVEATGK